MDALQLSRKHLKTRQVAIIEDNPDDEHLTRMGLGQLGLPIEIRSARDGAEGDALLEAVDFEPELILLDLKMPKMSGLDVLRSRRSKSGGLLRPIVMFTSSDDPGAIARCYEAGANSFVSKPVDVEPYLEIVRRTAEYWLEINQTIDN